VRFFKGAFLLEGSVMSYICHVCGKKSTSGNSVSHSNRRTRRTWKPNLRAIRIEEKGTVRKIKICTRCLRSNKVKKVV
jgi:large subunit ribosomal protein L28